MKSRLALQEILKRDKQVALVLLVIFFLTCSTSILNKYTTVDESLYIASGYSYLKTSDFRLQQEHPVLTKMLYGLPLLLINPKLPVGNKNWEASGNGINIGANYGFAADFYEANPESSRLIVFSTRLVAILLASALGFLIFQWARDAFGPKAGLLALFLYCFEPNIIANARLAALDLPLALFAFASFYFAWKFTKNARFSYLLFSAVSISLAILTKLSGLVFVPVLFLFLLLNHKEIAIKRVGFFEKKNLLVYYAFIFAVLLLVPLLLANIVYSFDANSPSTHSIIPTKLSRGMDFYKDYSREGYLLGEFHAYMPEYFLLAFLVKSTIPFILILLAAFFLFFKKPGLEPASTMLPGLIFFAGISIFVKMYIGFRYVLPAFPFLIVFAASVLAPRIGKIADEKKKILVFGLCSLLAWHALASLLIYPNYLAYFNELVGGPANGPKYLTDSNIDWGQDLYYFLDFVRENQIEKVNFIYFGWPFYNNRLFPEAHYAPSCKPVKGRLAISVSNLTGVTPENSKCYKWLRQKKPSKIINWTIYYYDIK